MQRCAGFFVSAKAEFSDYSELFELKSNAGDGQKDKQICAGYFLTSPKVAKTMMRLAREFGQMRMRARPRLRHRFLQ